MKLDPYSALHVCGLKPSDSQLQKRFMKIFEWGG